MFRQFISPCSILLSFNSFKFFSHINSIFTKHSNRYDYFRQFNTLSSHNTSYSKDFSITDQPSFLTDNYIMKNMFERYPTFWTNMMSNELLNQDSLGDIFKFEDDYITFSIHVRSKILEQLSDTVSIVSLLSIILRCPKNQLQLLHISPSYSPKNIKLTFKIIEHFEKNQGLDCTDIFFRLTTMFEKKQSKLFKYPFLADPKSLYHPMILDSHIETLHEKIEQYNMFRSDHTLPSLFEEFKVPFIGNEKTLFVHFSEISQALHAMRKHKPPYLLLKITIYERNDNIPLNKLFESDVYSPEIAEFIEEINQLEKEKEKIWKPKKTKKNLQKEIYQPSFDDLSMAQLYELDFKPSIVEEKNNPLCEYFILERALRAIDDIREQEGSNCKQLFAYFYVSVNPLDKLFNLYYSIAETQRLEDDKQIRRDRGQSSSASEDQFGLLNSSEDDDIDQNSFQYLDENIT